MRAFLGKEETMRDYIVTYTGKRFYATNPSPDSIDIRDIAHALSYLCRGNGQVTQFFSVAQHCLHCAREALARGLSSRIALACLLHDASEAYMTDVPRPYKQYLTGYREQEDRLLSVIYQIFLGSPLTEAEASAVKAIDDDMLWYDLHVLLHNSQEGQQPVMSSDFSYEFLPFEEVERQYLSLFEELINHNLIM